MRAASSTTPALSFVPPRSTPITQPPSIAEPPYSAMSEPPERSRRSLQEPPAYTKYRARPRLLDRGGDALGRLRRDGDRPARRRPRSPPRPTLAPAIGPRARSI